MSEKLTVMASRDEVKLAADLIVYENDFMLEYSTHEISDGKASLTCHVHANQQYDVNDALSDVLIYLDELLGLTYELLELDWVDEDQILDMVTFYYDLLED